MTEAQWDRAVSVARMRFAQFAGRPPSYSETRAALEAAAPLLAPLAASLPVLPETREGESLRAIRARLATLSPSSSGGFIIAQIADLLPPAVSVVEPQRLSLPGESQPAEEEK